MWRFRKNSTTWSSGPSNLTEFKIFSTETPDIYLTGAILIDKLQNDVVVNSLFMSE